MRVLIAALLATSSAIQIGQSPCANVKCSSSISCTPPFKVRMPAENGGCCADCWSDAVKSPEDRSWTKGLTGGIGMNANAPTSCMKVVCLPLHCDQTQQGYESGRCCTTC